jgi:hypothetical protein
MRQPFWGPGLKPFLVWLACVLAFSAGVQWAVGKLTAHEPEMMDWCGPSGRCYRLEAPPRSLRPADDAARALSEK